MSAGTRAAGHAEAPQRSRCGGPLGASIPASELAALGDARDHVAFANAESIAAMGANPLDPATRDPAAEAGRRQGRDAASDVAALWA